MKETATPRVRAWSLARLLGVTAVAGLAIGALLSARKQAEFEQEIDAMERRATELELPLPDPAPPVPELQSRPPVDPRLLRDLPAFPNASPRDLFQGELIKGAPMSVAWFTTPETVDSVLDYYDEYFRLSEQPHRKHKYGPNSGYVGWFEEPEDLDAGPGEGLMHMISAIRQGDETVVLLSETNPLAILEAHPQPLPDGVFLPTNAERPTVLNLEAGGGNLNIHSRLVPARMGEVANDYLARLKQAGWSMSSPQQGDDSWTLNARRKGEAQVVSLFQRNAGVDIVITFHTLE